MNFEEFQKLVAKSYDVVKKFIQETDEQDINLFFESFSMGYSQTYVTMSYYSVTVNKEIKKLKQYLSKELWELLGESKEKVYVEIVFDENLNIKNVSKKN